VNIIAPPYLSLQSAEIDDANAAKLKRMLYTPLLLVKVGEIAVISVGALVILAASIYWWRARAYTHQVWSPVGVT